METRFRDILARAYNFHSPGEDVVANVPETDTAAVGATILNQGFNFTRGAWKAQELVKGVNWTTSLAAAFMERIMFVELLNPVSQSVRLFRNPARQNLRRDWQESRRNERCAKSPASYGGWELMRASLTSSTLRFLGFRKSAKQTGQPRWFCTEAFLIECL